MSIFKKKSTASPSSNPKTATSTPTIPQPQPEELWKDSIYAASLDVFEEYFSSIFFINTTDKTAFYEQVSDVDLDGRVWFASDQTKYFESIPVSYVKTVLKKAQRLLNSYIITKQQGYAKEFVTHYNAFAKILNPKNLLDETFDANELKKAYTSMEELFKAPQTDIVV